MNATSAFWPPNEQHSIFPIELRVDPSLPLIQKLAPHVYKLTAVGNAIRALQTSEGHFVNEQMAQTGLQESANLLVRLADSLSTPEAEVIRLRASGLLGGDQSQAAMRQAEIVEHQLVLLCGPMSTWYSKSETLLHGVVASTPVARLNELIRQADFRIDVALVHLQEILDQPKLRIRTEIPPFYVTNLFACGGEPNYYPKHFAYFLPEDEGIKRSPNKKTIVYSNVYNERFRIISMPLAEVALNSDRCLELGTDRSMEVLILWFRGHDIGHLLRLPKTDFRTLRHIGRGESIMLQEALADVMGYLMISGGPWQSLFRINRYESGFCFLAELLRYIRRGVGYFPDSGAGFFQLSYLLSNGYIELVNNDQKLAWDEGQLYKGLLALGQTLIQMVLNVDLKLTKRMLEEHSNSTNHRLASWLLNLGASTRHVPTSISYAMPE